MTPRAVAKKKRSDSGVPRERGRRTRERILRATERLVSRKGSPEFTLAEVSRESRLSIGGIYRRFADKDALMVALQERVYARMLAEFTQVLADANTRASALDSQVATLVAGIANILKRHAALLRIIVDATLTNEVVARNGQEAFLTHLALFKAQLLKYRRSITHERPEQAIDFCFNVVYELIASHFAFGRRGTTLDGGWAALVRNLQWFCISFLTGGTRRTA